MRHASVQVPGRVLSVLVPETSAEFRDGVNTRDFRGYDGMLFDYRSPQLVAITMEQTPIPLQLTFFGADRLAHTVIAAPPFSGIYRANWPSRWVMETRTPTYRVGDELRVL